jgi:hypothetical protein
MAPRHPKPPLPAPWGTKLPKPNAPSVPPGAPIPAYPILTEEVGYPPSPLANAGSKSSAPGASSRTSSLGATASKALQDVLGWKVKSDDPQSFVGALNQSFELSLVEGHTESKWTPRSYAVQSDLSGGIAGAQASVYTMAKTLLDQSLPLVTGLYALDPAADQEYVAALKELTSSQMTELVNELGYLGGPRVMRVHQYFQMLMGISITINSSGAAPAITVKPRRLEPPSPPPGEPPPPWPALSYKDADGILGTLGNLRDQLGLVEQTNKPLTHPSYVNSIEDEQNVTNFRIIVDYANSLLNAWTNSFRFFYNTTETPFLGTQLVLISRQLGVVSETVDEVRFVLDSVFISPAERQTLLITFPSGPHQVSPIFLEDQLSWMQKFVTEEAPAVVQTGGKIALGEDFCNIIYELCYQAWGTYKFAQANPSKAISTDRVQYSLAKLAMQLYELYQLTYTVGVSYLEPRP